MPLRVPVPPFKSGISGQLRGGQFLASMGVNPIFPLGRRAVQWMVRALRRYPTHRVSGADYDLVVAPHHQHKFSTKVLSSGRIHFQHRDVRPPCGYPRGHPALGEQRRDEPSEGRRDGQSSH